MHSIGSAVLEFFFRTWLSVVSNSLKLGFRLFIHPRIQRASFQEIYSKGTVTRSRTYFLLNDPCDAILPNFLGHFKTVTVWRPWQLSSRWLSSVNKSRTYWSQSIHPEKNKTERLESPDINMKTHNYNRTVHKSQEILTLIRSASIAYCSLWSGNQSLVE